MTKLKPWLLAAAVLGALGWAAVGSRGASAQPPARGGAAPSETLLPSPGDPPSIAPAPSFPTPRATGTAPPATGTYNSPPTTYRMVPRHRQVTEYVQEAISPEEQRREQELTKAIQRLRTAEGDEKEEVRTTLKKLLSDAYDSDLNRREEQLTELEERVAKLREALDRRRSSRSEVVAHRLRGIELDVEGLGYPAVQNPAPSSVPYYYTVPYPHPPGSPVSLPGPAHIPSPVAPNTNPSTPLRSGGFYSPPPTPNYNPTPLEPRLDTSR
ncbi:MAG: hypothetical protein KDB14_08235 [Planctomycetales bacterium]|nr:hypothetical protein [Planctomycetales bacterium]